MQTKIELKSALVGTALGAVIMLCVGAATAQNSAIGRYRLTAAQDNTYADLFKIDTVTGQVWKTPAYKPAPEFMAPDATN